MCQFIETVRIDNDEIVNLSYHNKRLNKTLQKFSSCNDEWKIEEYIIPQMEKIKSKCGIKLLMNYKARMLYDVDGVKDVTLSQYNMRNVNSLKCVYDDKIDYSYKYADRTRLNELFALRTDCDDVLIVKKGLVTDTSIANIALWDGKTWYTPQKPLLKGTQRESLLEKGIVEEADIAVDEITSYSKLMLFNSMIEWGMLEVDNNIVL